MAYKIEYTSSDGSGIVGGVRGLKEAKKEAKKLKSKFKDLSFIATVNKKDVTNKI